MNIILLLLIGLVAGVLGGVLGIGGAVVIIPALVFVLGYSQLEAQGTTLLMLVMPVGAMAAWYYHQNGYVDTRAALILGVTFFVGSYLGAKIAIHIPSELLRKSFAAMLVVIALKMFFDGSH